MVDMDRLQEADLWSLLYALDDTNQDICAKLDPHIAAKINDTYNLSSAAYHLGYYKNDYLPLTKSKINSLFRNYIHVWVSQNMGDFGKKYLIASQYQDISRYARWLDKDIINEVTEIWLSKDDYYDERHGWLSEVVDMNDDLCIPVSQKLIKIYTTRKSRRNLKRIEDFFVRVGTSHLGKICEQMDSSTPTIKACLLGRDDIDEKYTISGLKAIAKLTTQKKVKTKINFSMLKRLGPRSRLDAMKHLVGLLYWYYDSRKDTHQLPFTTIPTREEIAEFLFPCSIKYNSEVSKLMERYDELINKKEEDHV